MEKNKEIKIENRKKKNRRKKNQQSSAAGTHTAASTKENKNISKIINVRY